MTDHLDTSLDLRKLAEVLDEMVLAKRDLIN